MPVAKGILDDRIKHWEEEVGNAATLAEAGIEFVFSTQGNEDAQEFLKNLRMAIEQGLDTEVALGALTTVPARLFGLQDQLGSIETGKIANLVVMSDALENEKSKVKYSVVGGTVFEQKEPEKKSGRKGKSADEDSGEEESEDPDADEMDPDEKDPDETDEPADTDPEQTDEESDESDDESDEEEKKSDKDEIQVVDWPIETDDSRMPTTKTDGNVFISNANVVTAVNGELTDTSIIIRDGKITAIGKGLTAPEGFTVIDGTGAWVMPGIIDCHSHMVAGGNEGSLSVTPEVRLRRQHAQQRRKCVPRSSRRRNRGQHSAWQR